MDKIRIEAVRDFWNANPLCASSIPEEVGTAGYFEKYDKLREINEPIEFSYNLHEYLHFRGKRVLDVGCGNGYVLSKYAGEGAEVYGVDISETAVEITKRRFSLLSLPADIKVGNAEKLEFEDDYFDCVCSMGVLHHTHDTSKGVDEIHRVVKPNGRVILMFYHKDSMLNRWNFTLLPYIHPKYFGKKRQELVNMVDGAGNPKGSMYAHTELRELLSKFRHMYFFNRLIQKWMLWPFGKLIPQSILDALESKWGWFVYAKGWK
jgi:ubiquinone/menaquinone biosynthesis C-methylase UbiE